MALTGEKMAVSTSSEKNCINPLLAPSEGQEQLAAFSPAVR